MTAAILLSGDYSKRLHQKVLINLLKQSPGLRFYAVHNKGQNVFAKTIMLTAAV